MHGIQIKLSLRDIMSDTVRLNCSGIHQCRIQNMSYENAYINCMSEICTRENAQS